MIIKILLAASLLLSPIHFEDEPVGTNDGGDVITDPGGDISGPDISDGGDTGGDVGSTDTNEPGTDGGGLDVWDPGADVGAGEAEVPAENVGASDGGSSSVPVETPSYVTSSAVAAYTYRPDETESTYTEEQEVQPEKSERKVYSNQFLRTSRGAAPDVDYVRETLQEIVSDYAGEISICYQDLESGTLLSLEPKAFYPCSVVKLPCMVAAWQTLDVDEYEEDLEQMITISDNTSFNVLAAAAGTDAVNQVLADAGCSDSGVYHGLMPGSYFFDGDYDNVMSPRDAARVLKMLYEDGSKDAEDMLDLLSRCKDASALAMGLDDGVEFSHKSGWADSLYHDAGIVWIDGGDYVLSMFTDGTSKSAFEDVSAFVYQYQVELAEKRNANS